MKLQESISALKAEKRIKSLLDFRVVYSCSTAERTTVMQFQALDLYAIEAELFSSEDVMPAYDKLIEEIKSNEWVWLPGSVNICACFTKASSARSGLQTVAYDS